MPHVSPFDVPLGGQCKALGVLRLGDRVAATKIESLLQFSPHPWHERVVRLELQLPQQRMWMPNGVGFIGPSFADTKIDQFLSSARGTEGYWFEPSGVLY
jgi:hypothetical protein